MLSRISSRIHWTTGKAMRAIQGLHRYLITPLIGPRCRFEPSCSEYCCQAVEKLGCIRGIYIGAKRVLRCNGTNPGGFDPVP